MIRTNSKFLIFTLTITIPFQSNLFSIPTKISTPIKIAGTGTVLSVATFLSAALYVYETSQYRSNETYFTFVKQILKKAFSSKQHFKNITSAEANLVTLAQFCGATTIASWIAGGGKYFYDKKNTQIPPPAPNNSVNPEKPKQPAPLIPLDLQALNTNAGQPTKSEELPANTNASKPIVIEAVQTTATEKQLDTNSSQQGVDLKTPKQAPIEESKTIVAPVSEPTETAATQQPATTKEPETVVESEIKPTEEHQNSSEESVNPATESTVATPQPATIEEPEAIVEPVSKPTEEHQNASEESVNPTTDSTVVDHQQPVTTVAQTPQTESTQDKEEAERLAEEQQKATIEAKAKKDAEVAITRATTKELESLVTILQSGPIPTKDKYFSEEQKNALTRVFALFDEKKISNDQQLCNQLKKILPYAEGQLTRRTAKTNLNNHRTDPKFNEANARVNTLKTYIQKIEKSLSPQAEQ
jgi:hypothetical protein